MELLDLTYKAFGLDISDSYIKIIKLNKKRGKLSVSSAIQTDIKPGIVESGIIKNEKALAEAIRLSCNKAKGEKIKTKYVAFSLPEEESFLQVIRMPKMNSEELKSAVLFESENYIPIPIDQMYLDFQVIDTEKKLDFEDILIVATPKKIVDSYVACIESAGLTPILAEIESQSSARALVKDGFIKEAIAIINIGANNSDFSIFADGSVRFTLSLPISAMQLSKVTNTPTATFNQFISKVEKNIDYFQENALDKFFSESNQIKKIILSGDVPKQKNIAELISKKLGIETELGNPLINIPSLENDKCAPSFLPFSTAIGLALGSIKIEKEK